MIECEHCDAQFITEDKYVTHKEKCRGHIRMGELKTTLGQTAFNYYLTWFRKRKYNPPSETTFIKSAYYTAFLKFAKFTRKMGVSDVDFYIELMSKDGTIPAHWYDPYIYDYFINCFDTQCSPINHVKITFSMLDKLATTFDCKLSEVFKNLRAGDMTNLIQSRNLSPWVLLLSGKFKEYLTSITPDERKLVESTIKVNHWKDIIRSNEKYIPKIKNYIKEADL